MNLLKLQKKEKPQWIASYNYLCLLNLQKSAERFGPLNTIWEGGYIGEGCLCILKPYMKRGLRKNWEHNTHRGVLKRKTFDYICNQFVEHCQLEETKKYNIYCDKHEVKINLMENITLLCVERIDGSFVFILRNKQQIYLNIGNLKGK